ncbi:MAG: hypothetical protein V1928_02885 [Parcubacteria group bacterium]
MEHLIRKKSRINKQEKRRFAKTSATLAGQFSRVKAAKGYKLNKPKNVKIM